MLKTLVSGALYNILNIFTQIILGLLVFKEMLLHFGEADFGLWSLLFAIFAHVKLFEFGMGSLISKLVPVLHENDDNKRYFSTVFFAFITVSVVFLLLTISAVLLPINYGMSFEAAASVKLIILLLSINFICVFQTGAFHAFLTGNFKVGRLNAVRLFINIARSIAILYLLDIGYGVLATAIVFASMAALELVMLAAISANIGLFKLLNPKLCSVDSLRYVTKRGIRLLFLSINGYTRSNAAIIYCGVLFGPVMLVPLRIAGRLMEIYVEISTALNYLLTPYFSAISLTDTESNAFNRKFLISISCATILSLSIFINIFFLGEWFLTFWLKDVPSYTLEVLQIVAIGFCIANMQGPCTSVLISKNHEHVLMKICVTETLTLLITLWPFIEFFGVIGAAYSILLSLAISRAFLQPFMVCKTLDLSLLSYGKFLLIPGAFVSGLISIAYFISQQINIDNDVISALCFVALQGAVVLTAVLILFVKSKHEKRLNHIRL